MKKISLAFITLLLFTGCIKYKDKFRPDPDDPGLSILSHQALDVMSVYLNNQPWVRDFDRRIGPSPCLVRFRTGTVSVDTVAITWYGSFTHGNVSPLIAGFRDLTVLLPVPAGFTRNDFLQWNGRRFPESGTDVIITLGKNGLQGDLFYLDRVYGTGKLYFVRITEIGTPAQIAFTGLLEGDIPGLVSITKGRFDYVVRESNNQLP